MRYAALPYLLDFEAGRSFGETQLLQKAYDGEDSATPL
jgi:hypothetical protein